MDPLQPAVVAVGSFPAGTKHNIIPDDAHLQLTVRTITPEQREKTLAAITRITNAIAAAAGVPAERAPITCSSRVFMRLLTGGWWRPRISIKGALGRQIRYC